MKNLVKVLVVILMVTAFSEAKAQMSAGVGIVYGTDISSVGFSANGKYELNQEWTAAPSFTYFMKKNNVGWSALDLDMNYALSELDNVGSLYAIGGLNMTFWSIKYDLDFGGLGDYGSGSTTGSDFGINLGLGLKVPAGDNLTLAPELKYTLGGGGYLRAGICALFSF